MDIENRHRTDVSAYERGVGYSRGLKAGHFKNQDDIARTLKISAAQVSRLLKLARLPAVVLDAFNGPENICEGWGLDIIEALDDPQKRVATVRAARDVCSTAPRPAAREVYQALLSASAAGRRVPNRSHDEVVKGRDGRPLWAVEVSLGTVVQFGSFEEVLRGERTVGHGDGLRAIGGFGRRRGRRGLGSEGDHAGARPFGPRLKVKGQLTLRLGR